MKIRLMPYNRLERDMHNNHAGFFEKTIYSSGGIQSVIIQFNTDISMRQTTFNAFLAELFQYKIGEEKNRGRNNGLHTTQIGYDVLEQLNSHEIIQPLRETIGEDYDVTIYYVYTSDFGKEDKYNLTINLESKDKVSINTHSHAAKTWSLDLHLNINRGEDKVDSISVVKRKFAERLNKFRRGISSYFEMLDSLNEKNCKELGFEVIGRCPTPPLSRTPQTPVITDSGRCSVPPKRYNTRLWDAPLSAKRKREASLESAQEAETKNSGQYVIPRRRQSFDSKNDHPSPPKRRRWV